MLHFCIGSLFFSFLCRMLIFGYLIFLSSPCVFLIWFSCFIALTHFIVVTTGLINVIVFPSHVTKTTLLQPVPLYFISTCRRARYKHQMTPGSLFLGPSGGTIKGNLATIAGRPCAVDSFVPYWPPRLPLLEPFVQIHRWHFDT